MIESANKKAILVLRNVANSGKTETLRLFAGLLRQTYAETLLVLPASGEVPPLGDFRLILNINGLVIAIESQGDPNTGLLKRLQELVDDYHADIIFCSSRTKGDTMDAVRAIISQGFEGIWTSTYQTTRDHQNVNNLKASHILDLMRHLQWLP